MTPLRVEAIVPGPIYLPDGYVHLDSLLAAAVCLRDNIPPAHTESELVPIEIPVQRSPCGRFHLASASLVEVELYERRHLQRRFPVEQAQAISTMRKIHVSAGPTKSYRIPYEVQYLQDGRLTWFALGDEKGVRECLSLVHYLGKKRSVGHGRVQRWVVEETNAWEGFPVVLEGRPLRHLPPDYPGLVEPNVRYGNLSYPYWLKTREQLVAAPC